MGCCCAKYDQAVDDNDASLTESRVAISHTKQAQYLKQQGNLHFKKKAYLKAIKCYQQALVKVFLSKNKNPKELVYYTNLALAFKANGQFSQAIKIIENMQRQIFNASLNYVQLIAKGNVIKARCINSLTKKYIIDSTYTAQQSQAWLQKIQEAIQILRDIKKSSTIQVQEYLNNSLKIKMYLTKVKQNTAESQVIDYLKTRIRQNRNGLHNEKSWEKIKDTVSNQDTLLKQVESLYSKMHMKFIEEADEDQEYLVDPITYQKYKDPVIVPSGISYEQATLKEFFKKGEQYKDPITKEKFPIGEKVIVKNYALKNYITEMGKLHEIRKQDIELLVC